MIDYCISFFKNQKKEEAYKLYIADCLRLISENTAKFAGGKYMQVRFSELVPFKEEKKKQKEEQLTVDEVKRRIASKLNGGK